MVNPHLSVNSLYSLLVNWVPLSQMISSGVPITEKQKLWAEITSSEEKLDFSVHMEICCSNHQSKGNIQYLVKYVHTYYFPSLMHLRSFLVLCMIFIIPPFLICLLASLCGIMEWMLMVSMYTKGYFTKIPMCLRVFNPSSIGPVASKV